MKNIFAYIRVSTVKQGDGVSLEVQKRDIIQFARSKNLNIIEWFEEKKSASKGFRPQFNRMIELLYEKQANGFIAHKIDRMMRNRHDWAIINELIDDGCEVISADGTVLDDVNGRFMGDIQAAVATRYSHNLAQEAKKGLYGRLAQGILPFPAPIGYLNQGQGKHKIIDPVKATLIVQLFELYTKKGFSVLMLVDEMYQRGLRNLKNNRLCKNGIIRILRNPYYAGVIKIKGQLFKSGHEPIISMAVYKSAQEILSGKANARLRTHDFIFRRLIKCNNCGRSLIGEIQKGNIYYRCHSKECPKTSINESTAIHCLYKMFQAISLNEPEIVMVEKNIEQNKKDWSEKQLAVLQTLNLQKGALQSRIERITSLLIDGTIDKDIYNIEKNKILLEIQILEETERSVTGENTTFIEIIEKKLELAKSPILLHEMLNPSEKREHIKLLTSNLILEGKKLVFSMLFPYFELANRDIFSFGAPNQDTIRQTETKLVLGDPENELKIPEPLDEIGCKNFIEYLIQSRLNNLN